jgi:hypothetical protein
MREEDRVKEIEKGRQSERDSEGGENKILRKEDRMRERVCEKGERERGVSGLEWFL